MRVLIVNTSERTGGAALAANRLMDALNNNGVKAKMLVRDKLTDDITVVPLSHTLRNHLRFLWERWCIFWHLHFNRNRYRQHRCRYYAPVRIQGSRYYPPFVDQSRHAFTERYPQDTQQWQARCVDNARHLACHRHLPHHA